jgi:hypothetical protein
MFTVGACANAGRATLMRISGKYYSHKLRTRFVQCSFSHTLGYLQCFLVLHLGSRRIYTHFPIVTEHHEPLSTWLL